MPPTRAELESAFARHLARWNALDREGWIALFDPSVRFDDPVGVPTKHGLAAAARQWDASFVGDQRWQLDHRLIVYRGSEIACVVANSGRIGEKRFEFETIEVWTLGENGKFVHVRAYYDPPAEVDAYFQMPS